MNPPQFEDLMAMVSADKDLKDLFSADDPRVREIRRRRELATNTRARYAAAVAAVAQTPDGRLLFEALINMTFGRFDNVTSLGLPMETAIQLHAADDGAKDVVWQLMRLVRDGLEKPQQ